MKMQTKDYPSLEMIFIESEPNSRWHNYYHVSYQKNEWSKKKLWVVGINIWPGSFSPNRALYCTFSIREGTFLAKLNEPKFRKLHGAPYLCRFSPDGKYLIGTNHFYQDIRLFDYQRGKDYLLAEGGELKDGQLPDLRFFGWYPDSQHIWHWWWERKSEPVYYRQNIHSKRLTRLAPKEVSRIRTDWDLVRPDFLDVLPELHGDNRYAYSRDNKLRLRAAPSGRVEGEKGRGQPQLWLEWRDGRSKLLVKSGSHEWWAIIPLAVSSDARWVAWRGWRTEGEVGIDEIFLMDVAAGGSWSLFSPNAVLDTLSPTGGIGWLWFS